MDFYIYAICLGVGLLFTLISAVTGHLFGGHGDSDVGTGGHAAAGFEHTGMPGLSVFSPTTIAAFITAFGGFGMVFTTFEATRRPFISAPLSVVSGLLIAAAVFWLFNSIFQHTQSSSESHVLSLVGQTANVITPIPENGVGEIAYVDQGSRYSSPARAENGKAVPGGATVRITRIVGTQFYVTPVSS